MGILASVGDRGCGRPLEGGVGVPKASLGEPGAAGVVFGRETRLGGSCTQKKSKISIRLRSRRNLEDRHLCGDCSRGGKLTNDRVRIPITQNQQGQRAMKGCN